MNRFQSFWQAISSASGSTPKEGASKPDSEENDESQDEATVKVALAVSHRLFQRHLTPAEKKLAGQAIHYAVGAATGVAYAVSSEFIPEVTAGLGLPHGT